MTDIKHRVKQTVVGALQLEVSAEEIPDNEILFGGGLGVNSIAIMEVIVALEKEFVFEADDDELRIELFDSIESIVGYVKGRIGA